MSCRLYSGESHVSHDVRQGHGFPAGSISEMLEHRGPFLCSSLIPCFDLTAGDPQKYCTAFLYGEFPNVWIYFVK